MNIIDELELQLDENFAGLSKGLLSNEIQELLNYFAYILRAKPDNKEELRHYFDKIVISALKVLLKSEDIKDIDLKDVTSMNDINNKLEGIADPNQVSIIENCLKKVERIFKVRYIPIIISKSKQKQVGFS